MPVSTEMDHHADTVQVNSAWPSLLGRRKLGSEYNSEASFLTTLNASGWQTKVTNAGKMFYCIIAFLTSQ